jgi:hypothetical protein
MRVPISLAVLALGIAGCGGSASKAPSAHAPEQSPAGDIPDNQAYVPYAVPGAGYSVKVPEGWSRTNAAGAVTFTDKLNSIRLESRRSSSPPTVAQAKRTEVPRLARTVKGFGGASATEVTRGAGKAVRITYSAAGKANPVTGRTAAAAVERYLYFKGGREAVVTLTAPKGADNVDPWRIVSSSLRWR